MKSSINNLLGLLLLAVNGGGLARVFKTQS